MKLWVFKNQYGYSTIARNKEDKMYIQVQFKRGCEPNFEKVKIEIKEAFFSMYKNKAGFAFPKLVVMEYTIEDEQQSPDYQYNTPDFIPPLDDSDLPF